jgi:hypothetical protein
MTSAGFFGPVLIFLVLGPSSTVLSSRLFLLAWAFAAATLSGNFISFQVNDGRPLPRRRRLCGLGPIADGSSVVAVVVGTSAAWSHGRHIFSLFNDLGAAWTMDY